MSDALPTLIRLRRQSQDQAQTALARAIHAAAVADRTAQAAEDAIRAEQDAAGALTADDGAVEAFARWLPAARDRAHVAAQQAERAQAEVCRQRALLTACRSALESVQELSDGRAAAQAKLRQEQDARAMAELRPRRPQRQL